MVQDGRERRLPDAPRRPFEQLDVERSLARVDGPDRPRHGSLRGPRPGSTPVGTYRPVGAGHRSELGHSRLQGTRRQADVVGDTGQRVRRHTASSSPAPRPARPRSVTLRVPPPADSLDRSPRGETQPSARPTLRRRPERVNGLTSANATRPARRACPQLLEQALARKLVMVRSGPPVEGGGGMAKLQDRVAVITGGARGIGRSIALGMARRRRGDRGGRHRHAGTDDLTSEVDEAGSTVVLRQADVADGDAMEAIIAEAVGTFGRLDVLVNNAAAMEPWVMRTDVNVETTPVETWDRSMPSTSAVPSWPPSTPCPTCSRRPGRATSSTSRRRRDFTVTSRGGVQPRRRRRWRADPFDRDQPRAAGGPQQLHRARPHPDRCRPPEHAAGARQARRRHRLVRRPGRPVDVAALAVFLASDDSGYITGQTITWTAGSARCTNRGTWTRR